jgi:GT2 family glycosyltransferase
MTVSVLTLVRGRAAHLANLVRGLARQTTPPGELVIAHMGGPLIAVPGDVPFAVRVVDARSEGEALPLAAARNRAAEAARGDGFIFLDVDCIPGRDLVAAYTTALDDAVLMGEVRYLEPGAAAGAWDEASLAARGAPHPVRSVPTAQVPAPAGLFWSLSFAISRAAFDRVGGFDPGFAGYGAEDTDFAFRLREAGVPFRWVPGAVAYHQHHDTYDPPLQHAAAIVANARRFRERWGEWPMRGWLEAFAQRGVVAWEGDRLELIREPTERELAGALRAGALPAT